MPDSYQGMPVRGVTIEYSLKKPAFAHGFNSALVSSLFLPDDLYIDKWDQIWYERGWLFGRLMRRLGWTERLKKRPQKALITALRQATVKKEII